jgi:inhibitor of KinA sporulation pathway (predicted exonuclease)
MKILLLLLAVPLSALSQNIQQACEKSFAFKQEQIRCENSALSTYVVKTCTDIFKKYDRDFMNPRLACVELTKSEQDLDDCLKMNLNPNDFLRCLKGHDPNKVHAFCNSTFTRKHRKLRCMEAATTADVGKACVKNFKNPHNQLSCMRTTFYPLVIEACAQVLRGSNVSARINCSKLTEDAGRVFQCGQQYRTTNKILSCIGE